MKKQLGLLVALASAALLGLPTSASAAPVSGCVVTPGVAGFVCDIYEDDVTEFTHLQLPASIVEGYVVLLEMGAPDQSQANWSDIVHFYNDPPGPPNANAFGFLDFYSDPFAIDPAQIFAGVFLFEDANGNVDWYPDGFGQGNQYHFHSDGDNVPEPASLALIAAALLSLLAFGAMRRRGQI